MVTIRLFGMTKMMADNRSELAVSLQGARQVRDLVAALDASHPDIAELIHKKKVQVSVNHEIAHEDTTVRESDDVALLPPFAGGA